MLCEEIMKRDVEHIGADQSVEFAAQCMRYKNVGFLPVCDEAKHVLGTLTDRDIALRVVAEGKDANTTVRDVMSRDVIACNGRDDIHHAQRLMGQHQKSRIICTNDRDELIGVISLSDIAYWEESDRAARTMREVTARETRN